MGCTLCEGEKRFKPSRTKGHKGVETGQGPMPSVDAALLFCLVRGIPARLATDECADQPGKARLRVLNI